MTFTVPTELVDYIRGSTLDADRWLIRENPYGLTSCICTAAQLHSELAAYASAKLRKQAATIAAEAEWRAGTNERRRKEAAERKAYRANVTSQIQALWALLELGSGETAEVTLGCTVIKLTRSGAELKTLGESS